MKIKWRIPLLSCVFLFVVLAMSFFAPKVSAAIYNQNDNKVVEYLASREDDKLEIKLQFQFGFKNLEIYVCEKNDTESNCINYGHYKTKFTYDTPIMNTSSRDEVATYTNSFSAPNAGMKLGEYPDKYDSNHKPDNVYEIFVKVNFCTSRTEDYKDCILWEGGETPQVIFHDTLTMEIGYTGNVILNSTISDILNIVNNIVIPILWIILGILLIVRGIMLGMDIVKASDDPELRRRKISGLVWLFIGIFVGYAITITASIVMGYFGYGGLFS